MSKRPGTTTVEAGTLAPQVNSFPAVTQANLFLFTKATAGEIYRFHGDFMGINKGIKKGIFFMVMIGGVFFEINIWDAYFMVI